MSQEDFSQDDAQAERVRQTSLAIFRGLIQLVCPVLILVAFGAAMADHTGFVILSLFMCTVLYWASKEI